MSKLEDALKKVSFDQLTEMIRLTISNLEIGAEHSDKFHEISVIKKLISQVEGLERAALAVQESDPEQSERFVRARDWGVVVYGTLLSLWRIIEEGSIVRTSSEQDEVTVN